MQRLSKRLVGSLVLSGMALTGQLSAQEVVSPPAWRQFEIGGNTVSVNPDSAIDGKRAYEVLAEQDGLVLARLAVNRDGVLSGAWKTDLDNDGNPEIVVAVGQLNSTNKGAVDIHEWDGYKFVSVRVPGRIAAEQANYDGHDQYKLMDGQLIREFPRFRDSGGTWVPSGEKASYRYDMRSAQWVSM